MLNIKKKEKKRMSLVIPVWMKLIIHIEDMNMSRLSHRMDTTYSHLTKISIEMVKRGWLIKEKQGRVNKLTLTPKGKILQKTCAIIITEFKLQLLK